MHEAAISLLNADNAEFRNYDHCANNGF